MHYLLPAEMYKVQLILLKKQYNAATEEAELMCSKLKTESRVQSSAGIEIEIEGMKSQLITSRQI